MANRHWIGTGNWDGTTGSSANWGTGSGTGNPASGPGTGDAAIFDAGSAGGTCTVTGNIACQSLTLSNFTGTLDFSTNDNNITLSATGAFVDSAGAHTLNMGDGTWTFTAAAGGTLWNMGNASCTLNAVASAGTMVFSAANSWGAIRLGSKTTYPAVSFTGANTVWHFDSSSGTIASLALVPGSSVGIGLGLTITLTNAPTWVGTRAAPIVLFTISSGAAAVIACGSPLSLDWGILHRVTGSTSSAATNTVAYGVNTNWTVNSGPSTGGTAGVIGG